MDDRDPVDRSEESGADAIAITNRRVLDASREEHEGFPRMVRASDGRILLFTRLGTTHAYDPARIMLRTSADDGATWSERREIWRDPAGWSAHNPVAVVAPDGTVILWCSRYDYERNMRNHCVISRSTDGGETWERFEHFDASPHRTTYYVTDAIEVRGSLLAMATCFAPTAQEPAFNLLWRSDDNGESWREVCRHTEPEHNIGNEVAMAHLGADRLVVLLRGRHRDGTYRTWSDDLGQNWSAEEDVGGRVPKLQRPVLTHLHGSAWVLTGRRADADPLEVVAYISTDDCATFGRRTVIDRYRRDGAYTDTIVRPDGSILLAYYADPREKLKPDIHLVELRLANLD